MTSIFQQFKEAFIGKEKPKPKPKPKSKKETMNKLHEYRQRNPYSKNPSKARERNRNPTIVGPANPLVVRNYLNQKAMLLQKGNKPRKLPKRPVPNARQLPPAPYRMTKKQIAELKPVRIRRGNTLRAKKAKNVANKIRTRKNKERMNRMKSRRKGNIIYNPENGKWKKL